MKQQTNTHTIDHEAVMTFMNHDIKAAIFTVSIACNLAMFSIWIALQVILSNG